MTRRRILLIDRDSSYRKALANVLSREGHTVSVAGLDESRDAVGGFEGDTVLCDAAVLRSDPGLDERVRFMGARLIVIGAVESRTDGSTDASPVVLERPINMEGLRGVLRDE